MNVGYAPIAVADRLAIIQYYREMGGPRVAESFDQRLGRVIEQLRETPEIGLSVRGRAGVRVILLRRFPYKVFYRLEPRTITILHIRHTARRPLRPGAALGQMPGP